jgi:hypothetical protein
MRTLKFTFLFISRLRHRRGPNPQDREPVLDVQAHGSDDDQVPGTETTTRFVKNKSRHLEHKTVVFFYFLTPNFNKQIIFMNVRY